MAYIVPEDWDAPPIPVGQLREYLSKKLPHYAIPTIIIPLQVRNPEFIVLLLSSPFTH